MKKMINKLLIALLFLVQAPAFAQSISQSVVATAGDDQAAGNSQLSWTLGEIAVQTYTSGNNVVTEGFQQGVLLITSIGEQAPNVIVTAYPNPSYGELNITFNQDAPSEGVVMLYDITGKTLLKQSFSDVSKGSPLELDLRAFAPGIYMLEVKTSPQAKSQLFKIQKIN